MSVAALAHGMKGGTIWKIENVICMEIDEYKILWQVQLIDIWLGNFNSASIGPILLEWLAVRTREQLGAGTCTANTLINNGSEYLLRADD